MRLTRVTPAGRSAADDSLAAEEPLEIRLVHGPSERRRSGSLVITMRTPGDDVDLAYGFLFAEGLIDGTGDVAAARHCGPVPAGRRTTNVLRVELDPRRAVDLDRLDRNFVMNSSCGLCGKASLDALEVRAEKLSPEGGPWIDAATVRGLPAALLASQPSFNRTGGVHASGLFTVDGRLLCSREDVGRHNALDKLIGERLRAAAEDLALSVLVVSGRSSFEILQKALVARIPVVVAVGAPSSLAVELARRFGITLIGFARDERFNIYTHPSRVTGSPAVAASGTRRD